MCPEQNVTYVSERSRYIWNNCGTRLRAVGKAGQRRAGCTKRNIRLVETPPLCGQRSTRLHLTLGHLPAVDRVSIMFRDLLHYGFSHGQRIA